MKQLLIIWLSWMPLLTFGHVSLSDFTIDAQQVCGYEILEQSAACSIVAIETNAGTTLINVIAEIATSALPKTVQALCISAGGEPKFCEVAYDASKAIITIGGSKLVRGVTQGIRWLVRKIRIGNGRKGLKNRIAVEVHDFLAAENVKSVFNTYRSHGCMQWESVDINRDAMEFADWNQASDYQTAPDNRLSHSTYTLHWQWGNTKYDGLLKMNGPANGVLRVSFYDQSCPCVRLIEQAVALKTTQNAFSIQAKSPMDLATEQSLLDYGFNRFSITFDTYGGIHLEVSKGTEDQVAGSMNSIENQYRREALLEDYGW